MTYETQNVSELQPWHNYSEWVKSLKPEGLISEQSEERTVIEYFTCAPLDQAIWPQFLQEYTVHEIENSGYFVLFNEYFQYQEGFTISSGCGVPIGSNKNPHRVVILFENHFSYF